MADPLGGARAGDLGAPTINARKLRRQTPWEPVSELEVQERPPSTLENIDGAPLEAVPELEVRDPQGVL
jgi:hypothetical protein